MKKILLPVLMLILGLGGGVAAGIVLQPPAEETPEEGEDGAPTDPELSADMPPSSSSPSEDGPVEFLNMSNQFIIPLVDNGNVNGIVVTTLSLEVTEGTIADVNILEPKLRDQFLQVLFNHANNGGFDGNFTDFHYLKSLKDELLRNAQLVAGRSVRDVLILDLIRQDP